MLLILNTNLRARHMQLELSRGVLFSGTFRKTCPRARFTFIWKKIRYHVIPGLVCMLSANSSLYYRVLSFSCESFNLVIERLASAK